MSTNEHLQIRIHGDASLPTLVYLPGLHGDWTLVTSFRLAIAGRVRFVEFTYPRTLTWSLDDYAAAVEAELLTNGIERGWLLGESFSSQVAWAMIGKNDGGNNRFHCDGFILTNGFVRHPVIWGVRLAKRFCTGVSLTWLTRFLYVYAKYARFRHRHAPETMVCIDEFIARRTDLDRCAAAHRLGLIAKNDLRPVARQTKLPVYYLAGLVDPIVAVALRSVVAESELSRLPWRQNHLASGSQRTRHSAKNFRRPGCELVGGSAQSGNCIARS